MNNGLNLCNGGLYTVKCFLLNQNLSQKLIPADSCPEEEDEGTGLPAHPVALHSQLSRIQWSGLN